MFARAFLFVCLALLFSGSSSASLILTLQPVGPTTVSIGSSVTIQLVATDPDGGQLGSFNWAGFNSRITASTNDANEAPLATLNPGFTFPVSNTFNFDSLTGRTIGGVSFAGFPSASGNVLATFTYTASVLGDTVFGFNNTIPGFNSLDLASLPPFTTDTGLTLVGTTITAVPEPTSILLVGAACGALAFRRTKTKSHRRQV